MSKRWQWALLVPYLAIFAFLVWQRAYILLQLLAGAIFTAQGVWTLWRHYTRRAHYNAAQVRWTGWVNLGLGPLIVGLTWYGAAAEQRAAAEPKIWCGGKVWQGYGRPPDECGADALRPMAPWQPAPMQRVPEPAERSP